MVLVKNMCIVLQIARLPWLMTPLCISGGESESLNRPPSVQQERMTDLCCVILSLSSCSLSFNPIIYSSHHLILHVSLAGHSGCEISTNRLNNVPVMQLFTVQSQGKSMWKTFVHSSCKCGNGLRLDCDCENSLTTCTERAREKFMDFLMVSHLNSDLSNYCTGEGKQGPQSSFPCFS